MSQLDLVELIKKCNGFQKNTFTILGPSTFAYFKNLHGREILLFGESHIPIASDRPHDILSWAFIENLIDNNSNSCVDVFMESAFKTISDELDYKDNIDVDTYLYDIKLSNGTVEYNVDVKSILEPMIKAGHKIKFEDEDKVTVVNNNIYKLSDIKNGVKVYINGNLEIIIKASFSFSANYHLGYGRNLFKALIKDSEITNKLRYHRWDLTQIEDKINLYYFNGIYMSISEICLQLYENKSIDSNRFIDLILNEPLDGYDRTFVKKNKLTKFDDHTLDYKKLELKSISNPISLSFDAKNSGIPNIGTLFSKKTFTKDEFIEFVKMFLGIIPFEEEKIKKLYKSIFVPFLNHPDLNHIMKQNKDNYLSLALLDKIAKKTKKQIDKLSKLVDNVDKLINKFISSFIWHDDYIRKKENDWFTFFSTLRAIQTDIYAFARMFGDFGLKQHKCDTYGQMKKIIYYGGYEHTDNIIKLINLFFQESPHERGRNQMNIRQGFVDLPKLNYFDIDYNKLVPQ